jgi:DNA-binding CsgD family transcriptional regulator
VLHGIARGLSDKELAAQLELNPNTLHGHLKRLYRRLGVASRLELVTRYGRLTR